MPPRPRSRSRSVDAVSAAETLKCISGNDPLYADRKFREPLSAVRVFCKPVIMCNRMPSIPDPSGALAARFRVLPFEESFAGKEEPRFKDPEIMKREATGRMLWALLGLRDLVRSGGFAQPKSGNEMLDEYRDYSDPLAKFVDECLERDESAQVTTAELYKAWAAYCNRSGRDAHSDTWFAMQLRTALPNIKRVQTGENRARGYQGFRIRIGVATSIDDAPTIYPI